MYINFFGAKYHLHGPRGYGVGTCWREMEVSEVEEPHLLNGVKKYLEECTDAVSIPVVEEQCWEKIRCLQRELEEHVRKGKVEEFRKTCLLEFKYSGKGYTYRYWLMVTGEKFKTARHASGWEEIH